MIEIFAPNPALHGSVEGYWASWANTADTTRLLPDGRVDVVLALGESARSAAIYGSVSAPVEVPVKPGVSYVGIRFRPGMARHFIKPAMADTNDAVMEDASLLRFPVQRAIDANTLQAVVAALDSALLRHEREAVPAASRVDRMVGLAVRTRGTATVGDLASAFDVSCRQVERDFQQALGMPPKAFLAIQRFLFARALLHRGTPPALAAVDAGYTDQSHMHRDMRKLSGQTPARCLRADVGFLQDQTALSWNHGAFQP